MIANVKILTSDWNNRWTLREQEILRHSILRAGQWEGFISHVSRSSLLSFAALVFRRLLSFADTLVLRDRKKWRSEAAVWGPFCPKELSHPTYLLLYVYGLHCCVPFGQQFPLLFSQIKQAIPHLFRFELFISLRQTIPFILPHHQIIHTYLCRSGLVPKKCSVRWCAQVQQAFPLFLWGNAPGLVTCQKIFALALPLHSGSFLLQRLVCSCYVKALGLGRDIVLHFVFLFAHVNSCPRNMQASLVRQPLLYGSNSVDVLEIWDTLFLFQMRALPGNI